MNDRFHHRELRLLKTDSISVARFAGSGFLLLPDPRAYARGYTLPRLRRSWLATSVVLIVAGLIALSAVAHSQTHQPIPPDQRLRYQIRLTLDFDNRAYNGTERVRFVNRGEHPTSTLFFHLYPNVRVPSGATLATASDGGSGPRATDEPRLEIIGVRKAGEGSTLTSSLDEQETTLRVYLVEPVAPNAATEIEISFKGSLPEIDPEETGLVTHIMQQVSAALRSTREMRRARDINFRCRGVMMLGSFYPVLAARDGDDWFRKIEPSIGDTVMTNVADYDVSVDAPGNIAVYTAVAGTALAQREGVSSTEFVAE